MPTSRSALPGTWQMGKGWCGISDESQSKPTVTQVLIGRKLTGIEDRIYVQDPELLHFRMRELRDNWHWVGEVEWPGFRWLGLKAFLYVRRDSPHVDALISALSNVIAFEPGQVDLYQIE